MALNYDFDVYSEIPRGIFSDEPITRTTDAVKDHPYWESHKVALFRDPNTVKAFHTAPKKIRNIFLDSGFGSRRSLSKIPKGYYLVSDNGFRSQVLNDLEMNLASQLTEKELCKALSVKDAAPEEKTYDFFKRMEKISTKKPETPFNITTFVDAALAAKSVAVPKVVAQKLTSTHAATLTSADLPVFLLAVVPRLAFMFYIFMYSTTQMNAAALIGG